jgi:hypothetical protein
VWHIPKRARRLTVSCHHAPVAQLDRAGGFYPSGCGFDSCRGRHQAVSSSQLSRHFTMASPCGSRTRSGRSLHSAPAQGPPRRQPGRPVASICVNGDLAICQSVYATTCSSSSNAAGISHEGTGRYVLTGLVSGLMKRVAVYYRHKEGVSQTVSRRVARGGNTATERGARFRNDLRVCLPL